MFGLLWVCALNSYWGVGNYPLNREETLADKENYGSRVLMVNACRIGEEFGKYIHVRRDGKKCSKFCLLIVYFIFTVCACAVVVSSWELPVRLEEDLYKIRLYSRFLVEKPEWRDCGE